MKRSKQQPVCLNCEAPEDYNKRSNYNGIAVVGIVMMVLFLLCLTALIFYLGGPARLMAVAG